MGQFLVGSATKGARGEGAERNHDVTGSLRKWKQLTLGLALQEVVPDRVGDDRGPKEPIRAAPAVGDDHCWQRQKKGDPRGQKDRLVSVSGRSYQALADP